MWLIYNKYIFFPMMHFYLLVPEVVKKVFWFRIIGQTLKGNLKRMSVYKQFRQFIITQHYVTGEMSHIFPAAWSLKTFRSICPPSTPQHQQLFSH